jgi:chorismate dehydratase
MLAEHDAALLIGDPGLAHYFAQAAPTRLFDAIDLAHAWHDWTGLPFVFAAWLARRADAALVGLLRAARLRSHAAIPEIAACEAARLDLPEDVCRYYLEEVIRYELGPREEAGLAQFAAYLAELDAADVQTGGTP